MVTQPTREGIFTLGTEAEREALATALRACGRSVRVFNTVVGSRGQFTLLQLAVSERPSPKIVQVFAE